MPFTNFDTAARAALSFLHRRFGFGLWMVTRTVGDDWIVLQAEDHGYGVTDGTVFRWADSFCSRMVTGLGPRVAPSSAEIPAYLSAPIGQQVKIGAYIGVPLTNREGGLFGTLCAIDPDSQPNSIQGEQEMIEIIGSLLSSLLATEMQFSDEARRAERAEAEALSDPLTGLYNRRGWSRLLAGEEGRCGRHGCPASVVMIDLDGLKKANDRLGHFAGDQLIVQAATVLRSVARRHDVAARVGGDEFSLLAVECDRAQSVVLMGRLRRAFAEAGIEASMGWEPRDPAKGLEVAWADADSAMYIDKRARQAAAPRFIECPGDVGTETLAHAPGDYISTMGRISTVPSITVR